MERQTNSLPPPCRPIACCEHQLPERDEGLRDTLYFAVYEKTVMFDTLRNAFAYQERCRSIGVASFPVIVKEDGRMLVSLPRCIIQKPAAAEYREVYSQADGR